MWVKKQQLELDMEELTGSNLGKKYVKAVYCHLAYLTYMQRVCVCVCVRARVQAESFCQGPLFVTEWTVAHQVLLSVEFSRKEYQSGLPFSLLGVLPRP